MRFSTNKVKSILISACINNNRSNLFIKTYEFKRNKLIKKTLKLQLHEIS